MRFWWLSFEKGDNYLDKHRLLEVQRLPLDHFKVYKSLTQYASVDKIFLYKVLAISLHNRRPKKNGKPLTRLCESNEFREKVKKNNLINVNKTGVGIPQGSPLSGILSNIYMMDFDRAVHQFMREINGNYYRYCDDILCIGTIETEIEIRSFIEKQIALLKRKPPTIPYCGGCQICVSSSSIWLSGWLSRCFSISVKYAYATGCLAYYCIEILGLPHIVTILMKTWFT